MAAVCPPPPPPLPPPRPSGGVQSPVCPPCPKHAALPWFPPGNPSAPGSGSPSQGAAAPPQLSEPHGPTQEQEDSLSDPEEKWHPVQETDPVPEALEGLQLAEAQHEGENIKT